MPSDIEPALAVCRILEGCWRQTRQLNVVTKEDLVTATPLLIQSGAGGLAWNRIGSIEELAKIAEYKKLKNVHQLLVLEFEKTTKTLFALDEKLTAAGITALMFKGRSLSVYYQPPHTRPCGDIDLWVSPRDFETALECLEQFSSAIYQEPEGDVSVILNSNFQKKGQCKVDLHRSLARFKMPCGDDFLRDATEDRNQFSSHLATLKPEYHLRLIAVHFLRHGGWRPLWLCDIAAMIESINSDFDWSQCLGEDAVTKSWVSAAIGLAQNLLGADTTSVPSDVDLTVPGWLEETVLKEWRNPDPNRFMHSRLPETLHTPRHFWRELKKRWPNPLIATTRLNTPITDKACLERQIFYFASIPLRFLRRTDSARKVAS